MIVKIDKQALSDKLIFNKEVKYNDNIILRPIKMKNIIEFQLYQSAFTVRKDSIFHEKDIIKMSYLDFIKYTYGNQELAISYKTPELYMYYVFTIELLRLACGKDATIQTNNETLDIKINDCLITSEMFDDIRRIVILQNDIDFDIDEFMNIDTVHALEKARAFEAKKAKEKADIEDYIDSLIIDLKVTEEYVENLTIRKFWRYIKRINKHEEYQSCRSAMMSGMVTFKEPLQHWMTSIEVADKYEGLKADENELRSKIE